MERKADKLAGKGSFLDKLRKRREMIESGNIADSYEKEQKPNKNEKRGYTKEKWDEK